MLVITPEKCKQKDKNMFSQRQRSVSSGSSKPKRHLSHSFLLIDVLADRNGGTNKKNGFLFILFYK